MEIAKKMNKFTAEQLQCIDFFPNAKDTYQHLLIEAGAGAGKTEVLTKRTTWLLRQKKINPAHIYIVTFSRDATTQIQKRIEKELLQIPEFSELCSFVNISTIDSFFSDLVNCIYPSWWEKSKKNNRYSMPPKLQLIDEINVQQDTLNAIHFFLNNTLHDKDNLSYAIDFILAGGLKKGFIQNQGTIDNILKTMSSETFLAANTNELRIAAQEMHPATSFLIDNFHKIARTLYEQRIQRGEFTYADRTVFLSENLSNNIPVQLKELIVDEYQDTNSIQHSILFNMVLELKARMVVVGDPKQSIYGFRNASVDVFQSLKTQHTWKHIELKKNFRSNKTLLQEINKLSDISFAWQNPNFPIEFKNSYFYNQSLKKYIPANALEYGEKETKNDSEIQNEIPSSIYIVTTSINKDRLKNVDINTNNIKFEEYSLLVFADFIKKFQAKNNINWDKIVVLCEENNDVQKITEVLKNNSIPVQSTTKKDIKNLRFLENQVALCLAKYLVGEADDFDLYLIMQSPISPLTHEEIEMHFTFAKKNVSFDNTFINLLNSYRNIAKDNFFYAWQVLRWKLVLLHVDEKSRYEASLFCAKMDLFSSILSKKLESPTFRDKIENKILALLGAQENQSTIIKDLLFPNCVNDWEIEAWDSENCISDCFLEVKTVHRAKGLEWDYVCFYPKFGRAKTYNNFNVYLSDNHMDICWLNEDDNKLSIVNWIKNPNFQEIDNLKIYDSKGNFKKTCFFSKLRKQAEELFERQRVFYTAFTRAKKSLILFQPKTQKKHGYRDILANYSPNENFSFQKYLEEDVYLRYLDFNFELKENLKAKNKKLKINFNNTISEPWFQQEEIEPKPLTNKNNGVEYYDYGPNFIENIYLESKKKNTTNFDFESIDYNFFDLSKVINNDSNTSILENYTPYSIKNILCDIKQKKQQIINKTKGIHFHAAAENNKTIKNSFQNLVEKNSIKYFHELEIWTPKNNHLNFIETSRKIIDFLSILCFDNFLELNIKKIYCINTNTVIEFDEFLNQFRNIENIILILDYKTGVFKNQHISQIKTYLELINPLNQNLLSSIGVNKQTRYLQIGCLCYNNKINSEISLEFNGQNLPFHYFSQNELLFFLV